MRRLALLDSSPALRLRIDQYLKEQWPGAIIDLIDPTPENLDVKRAAWEGYDALIIGFIEDAVAALDLVYLLKNHAAAPRVLYLASNEFQSRGSEAFLSLAQASLPRETLNRFDLRNTLASLSPGESGNPLDTATRAITAHLKSREAEAQQPQQFLTTGPITAFNAMSPRIAVLDSAYGSRTLIGLFLRQRWPNAVIDSIDPFTETMHGLHSIAAPDANLVIIGSIGSLAEATNVLGKLRNRPSPPGVILLISAELEPLARQLAEAGAHAVLLRESLSARDLIDASTRLMRQEGEPPLQLDPARAQVPDARSRGVFPLIVQGRRQDIAIERFRMLGKLAGNENNHVFYAERLRDRKRAVVKVMNGAPVEQKKALHSFIDLYVYLSAKEERSLVKVLDGGIAGDYPYMAFEYLVSGDLRRAMQEPLAPQDALRITRMIATALAVLHADRLAHMDVKPENVFFRDDGSIVLIDFTLATRFGLVAGMRGVGEVMGTPFYMSPEHGQGLPVDGRSDFYSLGVLFHEMLTGQKPFTAEGAAALIYKHIHDEVPLLSLRFRAYQPLVDKLMAKRPEDRFQTAADLLAALDVLKATLPPPHHA
ncbi:MAG: serine/threonine protein kinase [Betaproteobacteria bacterium]|nr:serine/threonine protein kinase [Betaproteobacteria bacterium]